MYNSVDNADIDLDLLTIAVFDRRVIGFDPDIMNELSYISSAVWVC